PLGGGLFYVRRGLLSRRPAVGVTWGPPALRPGGGGNPRYQSDVSARRRGGSSSSRGWSANRFTAVGVSQSRKFVNCRGMPKSSSLSAAIADWRSSRFLLVTRN